MNKRRYRKMVKKTCGYCHDVDMGMDGIVGSLERRLVGGLSNPIISERYINYCPYCGRKLY